MNIVKLQNDLKDLSDRQLLDTMQTGSAPQYLVLGEMQRRKKMRSEAQSKPQQPTSVADDIMAPPAQPQGLAGMPQVPQVAMASGGIVGFAGGREVYKDIESIESSGRQYDAEGNVLTSPKGAKGVMQVMPTTAMDPGYGAKNIFQLADDLGVDYGGKKDLKTAELLLSNEMLNRAMGEEYFKAMENRFGSEDAALAAYNAGPGRVGRSGFDESGDREALPEETQDYLAKADKLRGERELPTQTAAEGIAALGEGKMQLTDSEKAPTQQTARGAEREAIRSIVNNEPVDWTNVPGDSPLRGAEGTRDEDARLNYDQGGASDVRDVMGWQYGSPTIYENTTDPLNYNLPIRPTGDDGLMALAPKTPYGRPRELLEGEKIVNAAERATAEDYEEVRPQQTNEYGDYLASLESLPMMSASDAMAALGETRGSYGPGEMSPAKPSGDDPSLDFTEPPRRAYFEDADPMPGPAPKSNQFQRKFGAPGARPREDGGLLNLIDKLKSGTTANPAENAGVLAQLEEIERSQANKDFDAGAQARMDEIARRSGEVIPETKPEAPKPAPVPETKKSKADDNDFTDDDPIKTPVVDDQETQYSPVRDDSMADFLMRAGLATMASKNTGFLGALGEGGLKGLESLDKSKETARKSEEARMLEEGRMSRQQMAGEASLEAARLRGAYSLIGSLAKQVAKIDEEIADPIKAAQPSVIEALKATRTKLMQDIEKLQKQVAGAQSGVTKESLKRVS